MTVYAFDTMSASMTDSHLSDIHMSDAQMSGPSSLVSPYAGILKNIYHCEDRDKLRLFMTNAHKKGVIEVRNMAVRRFAHLSLAHQGQTPQAPLWAVLDLYEFMTSWIKGGGYKMTATREKVQAVGIAEVMQLWVKGGRHDRISKILVDWRLDDLCLEAVAMECTALPAQIRKLAKEKYQQLQNP